ncbi:MAG: hypothetical protein P8012_03080 [Desulfobacterales bacterium]
MGLIQRTIEASGIATISISLSKDISRKVLPPRAVYTGLPLGHPIAFPGETFRQKQILRLLLEYLKKMKSPGTIAELDLTESDDSPVTCDICMFG